MKYLKTIYYHFKQPKKKNCSAVALRRILENCIKKIVKAYLYQVETEGCSQVVFMEMNLLINVMLCLVSLQMFCLFFIRIKKFWCR